MRLAFFGTPKIAQTMLNRLLEASEDDVIVAISQPDRKQGRGQHLEPTPVKSAAESRGVRVLQPTKLKDGALAAELKLLAIDLAIVVAYGRILPVELFEAPIHQSWNVHASLLPKHRGASPIQHAILEGDSETGVDLMEVGAGLDEGAVLLERRIPLNGTETTGTLTETLAQLGGELLVDGLRRAKSEGLVPKPQDGSQATHAPLLEKKDGELDLTQTAVALDRRIRAVDPWPGASIPGPGGPLKILAASVTAESGAPWTVLATGDVLTLATGEGALAIRTLQPAGKKPMTAADFLRGAGRKIRIGNRWSEVLES